MKTIYRVEGKCRHNHKSLKAANKCMKEIGGTRVIASDDNKVSWRCLSGQEVLDVKKG